MKPLIKPQLAALAAAIAVIGVGATLWTESTEVHAEAAAALPIVKYQLAQQRTIADSQDYTGRLEAVEVVDVRPRVPGTLLSVHFKPGQQVRQGELLFSIDPAPYQTQVNQAQANLAAAQTRKQLAETDQARGRRLVEANAISRREFDALDNASREAAAALKGAQAALEHAQLQLGYTQVRAPIAGRISRAEITAGNVLGAGGDAAPLTRIVSNDKLYAAFNVDEQSYLRIIAPSLRAGKPSQVHVGLANDSAFPYPATLEALDNRMDVRSGTVRVRARIDQASAEMLPGLQARVRLQGGVSYDAVMVDDALVGTDQDRKYLLIVNAQDKVERRFVELGVLQGKERVVRSGIEAGTRVINDGAFRAPPGTAVNAVAADNAGAGQP
ncbi:MULTISPECIES: efflux RND transporter periplasmic adaptor subunit [Pseudomonas]|jgi:multidrug efflux system membrane fusion protein|uniref:efflux RND transporter periplasmic adaptor subunit n=1 Tax=Pseudomonas TaxID=286 RepID=UPI0005B46247|nr:MULTISPECIES: efflux RND transporter periplasmic adaptor subunit [Pseudomonas]EIU4876312.1 efflux RND transporter periplasmic adaptor subunit [Pseudomonas aeruginosa]MBG5629141.1 efflux RND transporter periplasmic adaptor subunit [Pseudomonas aeruginosa]MBG6972513.1 efflux RND transporter periplasmic adaptor subunit [Pseudomonas aeruginosa]MBG7550742.1 efflux RND transporter periplasmic adaptor subunit [Pseudomonas aeruginosa]MCU9031568.1 efflux RND transporter periplasmic adaptor subunit [